MDRLKYEELFESLKPVDGLLPGNKVRSVLMDSKLPLDALSKIWDLADQDRDGSLDKHEFIVVSILLTVSDYYLDSNQFEPNLSLIYCVCEIFSTNSRPCI